MSEPRLTHDQVKQFRYALSRAAWAQMADIRIDLADLDLLVSHAERTLAPTLLTQAQLQAAGIPTANSTETA